MRAGARPPRRSYSAPGGFRSAFVRARRRLLSSRRLRAAGVGFVGLRFRGFIGWFVTRTYHLFQLPLVSRKLRVVLDWTVALFFRRDIAELSMLGHPAALGEGEERPSPGAPPPASN